MVWIILILSFSTIRWVLAVQLQMNDCIIETAESAQCNLCMLQFCF
jgi:hypothetical protein